MMLMLMPMRSLLLAAVLAMSTPLGAHADVPDRTVRPAQTTSAGSLGVERFGERGKPPIVLIPALFCGSWEWNREIAALARNHDVYAVTLPGFAGRAAVRTQISLALAARDLHRLIAREVGPGRAVIVGHSLGGTLAVYFAETYPRDPAGVVAVEGAYPVAPTRAQRVQRAEAAAAPYDGSPSRSRFGAILKERQLRYVITSPADVEKVDVLAEQSQPFAVAAWLREALSADLTPGLPRIRAPFVEIVPFDAGIDPYVGYKTLAAKRDAYARWTARAPHGRTVMIDGARHFVMFDRPTAFDAALFSAIADVLGGVSIPADLRASPRRRASS